MPRDDLRGEDTAILGSEVRELLVRHPPESYLRGCKLLVEIERRAGYNVPRDASAPKVRFNALDGSLARCSVCEEAPEGPERSVIVQVDGKGAVMLCGECVACCVSALATGPVERELQS